jgi:acetyl esterase/lipase
MINTKELFTIFIWGFSIIAHAQNIVFLGKLNSRPYMTVYQAKGKTTRLGVIVCSGGSYGRTADTEEGLPAARLLASKGITAFLLDYRLPQGQDSIPLADAQTAIAFVRLHAGQYALSKNEIGIMGFSAGGHLVSSIGTHFQNHYGNTPGCTNLRPDFMVLVYPVISMADSLTHASSRKNFLGAAPSNDQVMEFSNELQVSYQTPPTYVVAAVDDPVVNAVNSLYFSAALRQHHVKTDIFLYTSGGHGFGIDNGEASVQWTDDAIKWIKTKAWKTK